MSSIKINYKTFTQQTIFAIKITFFSKNSCNLKALNLLVPNLCEVHIIFLYKTLYLLDWRLEVTIENNALVKRMNEIKQKGTNMNIKVSLGNEMQKTQKIAKTDKKTLNIDQRIQTIKKIMKENEVFL